MQGSTPLRRLESNCSGVCGGKEVQSIYRHLRYVAFSSQRSPSSLVKLEQSVINKSEDYDRGNKQEDAVPAKTSVNPNPAHGQS